MLAKEELKTHAQEEMNQISKDPYKYSMYKTIVLLTNSFYVAMSAISTGRIKDEGKGAMGVIGSLFNEVGNDFPIFGRAVKIVGTFFTAIDNVLAQKKIQNFKNFALSSVEMAKISDKIARKLVKSELNNIKKPASENILSLVESALSVADAGIAQTIVEACNSFKEDFESRVRSSHLSPEERARELLEEQGKNDGEILAQAVLDTIFEGKYTSTRSERGIYEYTKAAVSIAYSREESLANSVAKEVILHFNGKIEAETKSPEGSNSEENQFGSARDQQIEGNEIKPENPTPLNGEISHHQGHIANPAGGGCRLRSCIILSAIINDNNPEIENLFAQIYNQHTNIKETVARGKFFEPVSGVPARKAAVYIEVHEDLRTDTTPKWSKKELMQRSLKLVPNEPISWNINYFQNNEIGRKLLSLAQIYYGEKAFEEMKDLGKERDLANEILKLAQEEGFEHVLEVFFGITDQKALETFENLISNEDQSGYFQYIYNALDNNYFTISAKYLIKNVASLQEKLENILNYGLEGSVVSILIEQINIIMEFAESGQRLITFRPPYRDPFDNGDHGPSGGSSGQYFENNNNNQTNEDFNEITIIPIIGLNSTIYEI